MFPRIQLWGWVDEWVSGCDHVELTTSLRVPLPSSSPTLTLVFKEKTRFTVKNANFPKTESRHRLCHILDLLECTCPVEMRKINRKEVTGTSIRINVLEVIETGTRSDVQEPRHKQLPRPDRNRD
jgi:hypothetical protein